MNRNFNIVIDLPAIAIRDYHAGMIELATYDPSHHLNLYVEDRQQRSVGCLLPEEARALRDHLNRIYPPDVSVGKVGATFEIADEASPVLARIVEKLDLLREKIAATKAELGALMTF